MQGWVSIHRSLQSHWLWADKPFSRGQAWIDILLLANHQDNKFLLGNELVEVEQGSFITSEVKLMERWGWSKSKVRSFLKLLESDEMLIKKSDTKKTTLTVVNYKHYQDKETTKEPPKNHQETAKEPPKDTNNNVNNVNNENKKENISLQIKNLRARYSDDELIVVDDYMDILRWTRGNGKIADSVIVKIYKEWEKHSIPKVIYGLNVYITNPKHHDKKENYCYGIIRNATAEEIVKQQQSKPKNSTSSRIGVPPSESVLGERADESW